MLIGYGCFMILKVHFSFDNGILVIIKANKMSSYLLDMYLIFMNVWCSVLSSKYFGRKGGKRWKFIVHE